MDNDREELTFTKEEWGRSPFGNDPKAQYWADNGRPLLWVEEYRDEHVVAYLDVAEGRMKLTVDGVEEIASGNEGCLANGDYVLLTAYFGDEYEGKVFKKIG